MLSIVTAPTSEPITLDEAKAFMRVTSDSDDMLITSMISAAREFVENHTGRQLMPATWELFSDSIVETLPKNPVSNIVSIEYLDSDLDYQTVDTADYYSFEEFGETRISYVTTPTLQDHKKAIKVTFESGYSDVPALLKAYILIKISTLYENREQFVIGAPINKFHDALIDSALDQYRVKVF